MYPFLLLFHRQRWLHAPAALLLVLLQRTPESVDRLCSQLPDAVATVRRRLGTDDL